MADSIPGSETPSMAGSLPTTELAGPTRGGQSPRPLPFIPSPGAGRIKASSGMFAAGHLTSRYLAEILPAHE